MDNLLGKNLISYLKYMYAENPQNKDFYHSLADKTRMMFNIQDYGADQQLDVSFNVNAMDWTALNGLTADWLGSGNKGLIDYANDLLSLFPELKIEPIPEQPTPEQPAVEQPAEPTVTQPEQEAIDYATAKTNVYGNQLDAEEIKERNNLLAQQAQYKSLLGSNWVNEILTQLGQLQAASIDSINQMADLAKQSTIAQAGAARTQVNADYIGVVDEIKQAANEARQMKNEDLNARGMYFSSVLTDALDKISVAEIQTIGKTEGQRVAKLAQIAADLVTSTANIDIETLKSKSNLTTQYGLQRLALISQDAKDKAGYEAILAGLEVSTKGVTDYYAKLKEGIPEMQAIYEYEALAPVKSAEAQAQYQQEQDAYQRDQDRIKNEIAIGHLTIAQGNYELAFSKYKLAIVEFNAKQDQQSFTNYIDAENLIISQAKLGLTYKMNEESIRNTESQIKLRDAQIWKIYNSVPSGGGAAGGAVMSFKEAMKMLDNRTSLIKDIGQLTKIVDGTGTNTTIILSDGTTITTGGKISQAQIDVAQKAIDYNKNQLSLLSNTYLHAEIVLLSRDNPEQATMITNFQNEVYAAFGATGDNDLNYYDVMEAYKNGTITDAETGGTTDLTDYLKTHGYTNVNSIILTWINSLPRYKRPRGGTP